MQKAKRAEEHQPTSTSDSDELHRGVDTSLHGPKVKLSELGGPISRKVVVYFKLEEGGDAWFAATVVSSSREKGTLNLIYDDGEEEEIRARSCRSAARS